MSHKFPLSLKPKDVHRYIELYHDRYGELLSYEEAEVSALNFLRFMSYVLD